MDRATKVNPHPKKNADEPGSAPTGGLRIELEVNRRRPGRKQRLLGFIATGSAILFSLFNAWSQEGDRREPGISFGATQKSELRRELESLQTPTLHWTFPVVGKDVERIREKNGITVYLKEDHRLPLVQISFLLRTGKIYEPKDKDGLAGLTGTVIRTGGTQTMSPEEVDRTLESIAASLEFSIGTEVGAGSLNLKSSDLDVGLKIVADMLRRPAFDGSKFELAKLQLKEAIRRRNDSLDSVASREFRKALYGEHPYGRVLEWKAVQAIQREDLVAFHRKYFHPNQLYVAVSGDFDRQTFLGKMDALFEDWKPEPVDFPQTARASGRSERKIILIPKKTNQSRIVFGHFGVDRDYPDAAAVEVLNMILGGAGFTSRITSRVRSDEGLAYSAGTSFPINTRDLSPFAGSMQTKTQSTHRALKLALEEVERIRREPVTDEELHTAKQILENRFLFQFSDPWVVVRLLMELEYEQRPPDFYQNHLKRLLAVTKEDLRRVATQRLRPDQMIIVVVGDPAGFDSPLSDFGTVQEVPLKDPISGSDPA